MALHPDDVMCRGIVGSQPRQGEPCAHQAVRDGYCRKHHPDRRVAVLAKAVHTAELNLQRARTAHVNALIVKITGE